MKILITGGAGFIGSTLVKYIINETDHQVVNLDKLTYAGNLKSLDSVSNNARYSFERIDITEFNPLFRSFEKYQPDSVMHLAAESHVDRSISGPEGFIKTNIVGTYVLLEVVKKYLHNLDRRKRVNFKLHHISTDEVYGDIDFSGDASKENDRYAPSSPYSASKASSDHLVRAWSRTYDLPFIITNSSNNYGPYHFPEKLIPLTILSALEGKNIPVYGKGNQIRDWLYVEDHAKALYKVLEEGVIGETYNIGGNSERRNIDVVIQICELLDEMDPASRKRGIKSYKDLISYVEDRPGHDLRYALDITKIKKELGWQPEETFESGLVKTVKWNLSNRKWSEDRLNGANQDEISQKKFSIT
tara:strand:- start:156 stop:1232 length:1077 start_codon:yes stop_codon:yes gene_type:complete